MVQGNCNLVHNQYHTTRKLHSALSTHHVTQENCNPIHIHYHTTSNRWFTLSSLCAVGEICSCRVTPLTFQFRMCWPRKPAFWSDTTFFWFLAFLSLIKLTTASNGQQLLGLASPVRSKKFTVARVLTSLLHWGLWIWLRVLDLAAAERCLLFSGWWSCTAPPMSLQHVLVKTPACH